jgi:hypothetical protein
MRYLARSALGKLGLGRGIMGERRPKNLRRGYFTRKSGIPHLMVNSLKRTLFFNLCLPSLLGGYRAVELAKRMSEHVTRNVAILCG